MTFKDSKKSKSKAPATKKCGLKAGTICPVCGFAKLVKEPGNIVKCPVCGFGQQYKFT